MNKKIAVLLGMGIFMISKLSLGCNTIEILFPDSQQTFHEVFAHGLGGNKDQGQYYHAKNPFDGFIEGPLSIFNFQDYLDQNLSCLGQEADINALHEVCKSKEKVIITGVSRGGATIINYLGSMQPENVVMAIVESPYDSAESISNSILGKFGKNSGSKLIPHKFPNYNPTGIHPIDVADKISKNTIIVIVCSKEDTLIKDEDSINIYKKIKDSGHPNVYLLHVEHGKHANILWGKDGHAYKNVVHAIKRHHNLPHNKQWAQLGHNQFLKCKSDPIIKPKKKQKHTFVAMQN